MTGVAVATLKCNRCGVVKVLAPSSGAELGRMWREAGWRIRSGKLYCAVCASFPCPRPRDMNKNATRHLPGDQGQPVCQGCKQKLRFGTNHDGAAIQWCACGEFPVATIRLRPVAVKAPRSHKAFGRPKPDHQASGRFRA